MKLNALLESNSEQAVNFSDDIGELSFLNAAFQKLYLSMGLAAIKAGFTYRGAAMHMQRFNCEKDDTLITLMLQPKRGTLFIEATNDGDQKFEWKDLDANDFHQHTEFDFSRIAKDITHLFDALDGAQKFIGTAPTFTS